MARPSVRACRVSQDASIAGSGGCALTARSLLPDARGGCGPVDSLRSNQCRSTVVA